jgi:hypothetical protein
VFLISGAIRLNRPKVVRWMFEQGWFDCVTADIWARRGLVEVMVWMWLSGKFIHHDKDTYDPTLSKYWDITHVPGNEKDYPRIDPLGRIFYSSICLPTIMDKCCQCKDRDGIFGLEGRIQWESEDFCLNCFVDHEIEARHKECYEHVYRFEFPIDHCTMSPNSVEWRK